ncbi:MAG: ChaN family lipoprotein [Candidatus Thiodiazotropha sp. (ex Monitilora ramsayi)]|nr:ChaN family lipoprotein [Candidatus Thiodiazotropha sp. (ex Monitilora ramsayi)]
MSSLFLLLISIMALSYADEKPTNAVVDLNSLMDMSSLVEKVADKQVVFVGESHDQYQHHLNQLAIIQGLHTLHPNLAIGLEFFFQPFQQVLDRYIAGEIEEHDLIRETEYFDRWRFDYRLYRPIFRFAREQGIPLIALNLESEITQQVGKAGIESLSEADKARLPKEIDRGVDAYRERIRAVYDQHPHMQGRDFENFLDVQLLWDEGMAERAAEWLQQHPDNHMVILAGVGHLAYREGIPARMMRRTPVSHAVILNANRADGLDSSLGDYLIVTDKVELPPAGKLGVFLDLGNSPPSISGFDKESGAAKAGVESGDRLLAIDGEPISTYTDIRIALMDKAVGDKVQIEVERERLLRGTFREIFSVTLN